VTLVRNDQPNAPIPAHPGRLRRQWWRRPAALLLAPWVLLLLGAAGLGLLLTHRPARYQPRTLNPEEQRFVSHLADLKASEFYNNTHRLEPFTIAFDEQLLNNLLVLDDTQLRLQHYFPAFMHRLRQPQIAFERDRILLMGQVALEGRPLVLIVCLAPSVDPQGRLHVVLDSVRAGAVSLPQHVLDRLLRELADALPPPQPDHSSPSPAARNDGPAELLAAASSLLADLIRHRQVTLNARFRAVEDKHAQLLALRLRPGALELDLQPLPARRPRSDAL